MPGGDGRGPMGRGPMTGRGAGYCAGYDVPGYMNAGPGMGYGMRMGWSGYGRGRGGGRGWRNMYYATGMPGWVRYGNPQAVSPVEEKDALRGEADMLKRQLADIEERIESLEKTDE